jgi:hypothetical protein
MKSSIRPDKESDSNEWLTRSKDKILGPSVGTFTIYRLMKI